MNAHTLRKLLRRENLIPIVALLLFSSFVVFGVAPGIAQSPEKEEKEERKIETRIPKHLPIKVVFKNEEKVKDLKNEDWIDDLEVEVTNTGTKPIYYLYIDLGLPDVVTGDQRTTILGLPLQYGRIQLINLTEPLESTDVPIKPGESIILKVDLPTDDSVSWKTLRAKGTYRNPKKLQFWFENLNFGDGTGFSTPEGLPVSVNGERRSNGPHPEGGEVARQTTYPAVSPPPSLDPAAPFFLAPVRFLAGDLFYVGDPVYEPARDICCSISRSDCRWLKTSPITVYASSIHTPVPRAVLTPRHIASRQEMKTQPIAPCPATTRNGASIL
jgi:hypothetical protein